MQDNEGIQDGQATTSAAQATSSMTVAKTALKDTTAPLSTRLQQQQMSIVISDEGWEPTKIHRRKKPEI